LGGIARSSAHIVQECSIGLVRIRRDGIRLSFAAPPLQRSLPSTEQVADAAAALGLDVSHIVAAQWLDNGPTWLGLLLDSEEIVLALEPNHLQLKNLGLKVGVAFLKPAQTATNLIARSNREARAFGSRPTAATANDTAQAQVRAFASPIGVNEDPVTGSFNASLAQWLIAEGLAPATYTATQGTRLGRFGQVHIAQDETGQVWVGGASVTCIDGTVRL
jgi:PhzF family phenazine biosynthesis protein